MKVDVSQISVRHSLPAQIHGESVYLCPERALYYPAERTMLVADLHFGKAATFRVHGIPVPSGTTRDNLDRLDAMIHRHNPKRIVFLGDLLHTRVAHTASIVEALQAWRNRHADLELILVRGNHDLHAGPPAAALHIQEVDEPWPLGPWTLCHHPQEIQGAYVIAGHVHPVYVLRSATDRIRLACFTFGARSGILPAFGDFTGGYIVRGGSEARSKAPADAQRIFVVTNDHVIEATPTRDR